MLFKTALLATLAVGSATAALAPRAPAHTRARALLTRQLPPGLSPEDLFTEACSSTCDPIQPLLQACIDLDIQGCLAFCQQDQYDAVMDCVQCEFDASDETVSEAEADELRGQLQGIEGTCAQLGQPVDSRELNIPTGGDSDASPSPSASASASGSSTNPSASASASASTTSPSGSASPAASSDPAASASASASPSPTSGATAQTNMLSGTGGVFGPAVLVVGAVLGAALL